MNEIDSIFGTQKAKINFNEKTEIAVKKKKKKKPKTTAKKLNDIETVVFNEKTVEKQELPEDELFQNSKGARKVTEDGLPVYFEDELKIGLGKDTPDCPFDCDCCF